MRSPDFTRARRVADHIGRELATLLQTKVVDPRLERVTVCGVELSPDLRNATVYITGAVGTQPEQVMQAFKHATPFLRRRLGQVVRMKYLPRLTFKWDSTLDQVDRMETLLKASDRTLKRAGE